MTADGVSTDAVLDRTLRLTTEFFDWEKRGRGWDLFDCPVELEPPFRPFRRELSAPRSRDDGRKPTTLGTWFANLFGPPRVLSETERVEQESEAFKAPPRTDRAHFSLVLPSSSDVDPQRAEHLLLTIAGNDPIAFEILASSGAISLQLVCTAGDSAHAREQFRAHHPDVVVAEGSDLLKKYWDQASGDSLVVEFALSEEFMRPLRTYRRFDADPLVGVCACLSQIDDGEAAAVQVLFSAVQNPWDKHTMEAVTDWEGNAFFLDAPELLPLAREKVSRPLLAVIIRVAVRSDEETRRLELAGHLRRAFSSLSNPPSNELIPLDNHGYPAAEHLADVFNRQSRRTGMLLSSNELVSLVHLPSPAVVSPRLTRTMRRTRAAPEGLGETGIPIGLNSHAGVARPILLSIEQRMKHVHVLGATGSGKSTLLLNMMLADLSQGNGFCVVDPHGDLVDSVLARVPEHRVEDVVVVDPSDLDHPVAFNVLTAHSDIEKTLLSSDLVAVFRRLSTSWGDQMTAVLSNAVLAFLESLTGGTLADLRRFLVEADYRREFLRAVSDPEVVYFWNREFPLLAGRPQAPLLTRLDTFLRPRIVRNMVTQRSCLDIARMMDDRKVILVKLAQGLIGEENAALLGSLVVSKIQQFALARQQQRAHERRPFFLYVDECQNVATPSLSTLLSGARKYAVGLTLAHQELRQLKSGDRDLASSLLSNAGTRICFRVGDDDAKDLESGFSDFGRQDLQSLAVGQAVVRVNRSDADFSLDVPNTAPPPGNSDERRLAVIELSRSKYASTPPERIPAVDEVRVEHPPEVQVRTSQTPQRAAPAKVAAHDEPFSRPPAALPAPGRGGAQHKYLQELIRRWGQANGWLVTLEKPVLDGIGNVDVSLERDGLRVACEISVSSSVEYEIGNVRKCLAAGYDRVLSIVDGRALGKRRAEIERAFDAAELARVVVVRVDDLFEVLGQFEKPRVGAPSTVRGYTVRVNAAADRSGATDRASTISKTVLSALRRLQRKDKS